MCQGSVAPDQISVFFPMYWHNSTLLPVTQYHFIPSSTKLYWPSTTMYQPVPPHIDQVSYISFGLVQVLFFYIYNVGFLTSALDCNEAGFVSFDRLKSFHLRLWLYHASFPCLRLIDFLFMDNIWKPFTSKHFAGENVSPADIKIPSWNISMDIFDTLGGQQKNHSSHFAAYLLRKRAERAGNVQWMQNKQSNFCQLFR